jgi:hypothetical protein
MEYFVLVKIECSRRQSQSVLEQQVLLHGADSGDVLHMKHIK